MAFAVPVPLNDRTSSNNNHSWGNNSGQADEATIDGYARKVLEDASPPDISVDADYLGPYVTGVLRAEGVATVEDLDDYDNILELLQEHCSMARQDAKLTLQKIATAVSTGTVPAEPTFPVSSPTLRPFGSPPTSGGFNALQLLETVNVEEAVTAAPTTAAPNLLQVDTNSAQNQKSAAASLISPMRPDKLIPIDLLGAIDCEEEDEEATITMLQLPVAATSRSPPEEEFPSLAVAAKQVTKRHSRASRSRQGSIDESSLLSDQSSNKIVSPSLQPTPAGSLQQQQQPYYYALDGETDPATMLQMACDMLTHMNPDMGQDAIFHACTMANADVGVAQYLMDCAMTAPPVCRHLLHAGCYRSDCQFSHDLEGHTCVFWLRGHCNKGTSCQFFHGYNEQWLIQLEEQQAKHYQNYQDESSWEQQQPEQQQATQTQPLTTSTNSFANIASQGYNNRTCFQATGGSGSGHSYHEETKFATPSAVPSIKIPQDVWNPHERRDASAFQIADPIKRYREVSRHTARTDVVDLHFQSTKTFAEVLGEVLPEKLAAQGAAGGLWIVTGTGHHVGSKTHQKGGGILEAAVQTWLTEEGYDFWKGKDRNGHGGAVFVKNAETRIQQ